MLLSMAFLIRPSGFGEKTSFQSNMSEFDLIRRLQNTVNAGHADVKYPADVGIGDDAAVLSIKNNQQLLVTTDTLVSGVHFPSETPAADIGFKSLAVSLSDLAAMGGEAGWFFLALTLPQADETWLDEFASGLAALSETAGVQLAGGDTTSGPLSITITALGLVPQGHALLRGTAAAGDLVVVSGTPGLAALGLADYKKNQSTAGLSWLALTRPQPRLALGKALRGTASSCIDISDGLLADLGHIAKASQMGAEIWLEHLPQADVMQLLQVADRWNMQLSGGDDYELCFTLPADREGELHDIAAKSGVSLTVIGQITEEPGLRCLLADGSGFVPRQAGFDHFPDSGK